MSRDNCKATYQQIRIYEVQSQHFSANKEDLQNKEVFAKLDVRSEVLPELSRDRVKGQVWGQQEEREMVRLSLQGHINAYENKYTNERRRESFSREPTNKMLDSFLPEFTSCCSITPQPRTSSHSPWKLISISKEG